MAEFTTLEIASRCQRTERTVQRWLTEGKLKALRIKGNVYEVDEKDLAPFLPHQVVDDYMDRLDALERRLSDVEGFIREIATTLPSRKLTPPRASYEHKTASQGSTLPDGYTPIADLIKQYNKSETTVMRNMRTYLHPGKWKTGDGRTVNYALDDAGLAEFLRRYVGE